MQAAGIGEELRFIAGMVRQQRLIFALAVGGAALYAAGAVAATIVFGRLVDDVIVPTFDSGTDVSAAAVVVWAVVVLVVAAFRVAGVVTRRYFAGMVSERLSRDQRTELTRRYARLPMSFLRRRSPGDLLAHVDFDTEVLVQVLHPLPFSCAVLFMGVFAAVAMLLVDPILAVIALVIFPAIIGFNRVYSRLITEPARAVQESVGDLSGVAHESFDGALVVKLLALEGHERRRFEAAADELRTHRLRVGWLRAWFEACLDALPRLGVVVVMIVGAWRISGGHLTIGELMQMAGLFTVLALPMRVLGFFLEEVPPAMAARKRIETVPVPPAVTADRVATDRSAPALELRDLSVGWEAGEPILRNVDLAVAPGETVALVGATGSGKSTLVETLTNELEPLAGEVLLAGTPLGELRPQLRAELLQFAFQEAFLFADSIDANVSLGRPGIGAEAVRAAIGEAQADGFIAELSDGVNTVVGQRGLTLSGGQRQRVALARALAGDPAVVVIDDAFSAVDAEVERRILDALRSRDPAPAMLIVAHRLSTIQLADRVVFLDGGRVAGTGSHDSLMALPAYEALASAYERGDLVT